MTASLIINQELRDLLPPLSDEEMAGLEVAILRDGCTDPLTVWGEIIVDGHHRYAVCKKHDLPFKVHHKEFDSLDDVKIWMWEHQDSRRNLTKYQRSVVALKMKPVLAARAKQNQKQSSGHGKKGLSKLINLNTQALLAKKARVATGTLHMVEFLELHAPEEIKQKLRADETSINKEYKRLKAEIDAQKPAKPQKPRSTKETTGSATATKATPHKAETKPPETKATKPEPKTEPTNTKTTTPESTPEANVLFQTGLYCRPGEKPGATGEPYVTKSSLTDLPHDQPEVLVAQLIAHFPRDYTRKCPFLILDALRANDGDETTVPLAQAIADEFGDR